MKQIKVEIVNRKEEKSKKTKLRVAAYCRVSTLKEEQELSFESQCSYYRKLIESNPNMVFSGIYGDQGFSGLHADKRPEFIRLIEDCQKGEIDLIMVKSISRFSRNVIESQMYINLLRENNVRVYFEKEKIYSDDIKCELILKLLSACAQEESNSISQTIRWANEKNNETGSPTRYCSYGFRKSDDDKRIWLIVEDKANRIRLMFKLADQGRSIREITVSLNEYEKIHGTSNYWSEYCVRYRLCNETYKGDLLIPKTYSPSLLSNKRLKNKGCVTQFYIEDHHKAIVNRELFDRVQRGRV